MSPAPADECLDQNARHKTLFEAYRSRNLPTGRGRGFERNDQGMLIVWTSPIRMAVIAVPDLLHRSRTDPEGAARTWRPGVRLNSGLILTAGRSDADAP